jgi:hypothetical protein
MCLMRVGWRTGVWQILEHDVRSINDLQNVGIIGMVTKHKLLPHSRVSICLVRSFGRFIVLQLVFVASPTDVLPLLR